MGFFQQVETEYGTVASHCLRQWAHINTKIAKTNCRRNFLLKCRSSGTKPRHIVENVKCIYNLLTDDARDNKRILEFNDKVSSKILSLEISLTIKKIGSLHTSLENIKNQSSSLLPEHIINKFSKTQEKSYNNSFRINKNLLDEKFSALYRREVSSYKHKDNWFKNLTSYNFPPDIKMFLSLGPKFCLPPVPYKTISMKVVLADVEGIIKLAPISTQDILRAKCTNAITNFIHTNKRTNTIEHELYYKTQRFLKDNNDILITRADKGNVTVALTREQYSSKIVSLIDDTTTYRRIYSDPTTRYQNKNNQFVKHLKDKKYIDSLTAKSLTTYKAVSPRIYGLPKIHKRDIPLRPIVSTLNSPTTELSKYVASILSNAFSGFHTYAVKDTFEFCEKVKNLQLPINYKIISLDVVSLFTNISWSLTRNLISDHWEHISAVTTIPQDEFLSLLKFLFEANYFQYEDQFYEQTFGCPMGSNLSPILASLTMTSLLKYCIPKLTYSLPLIHQYVDDLIISVPIDGTEEIVNVFNSFDSHITFVVEEETDRGVPFLDTKVVRSETNIIKLDWYQKSCSSGRYIHYKSSHDWKIKLNLVKGLLKRVRTIADPEFFPDAQNRLFKILLENGYPRSFLNKMFYGTSLIVPNRELTLAPIANDNPSNNNNNENNYTSSAQGEVDLVLSKFMSLPFIPGLTQKLCHILSGIENLKIAKYYPHSLSLLFSSLKAKIPTLLRCDCVYLISCKDCSSVYVGQTSQNLKRRIALHKSDIRIHPERCALAGHASNLGHQFNFDETKILCQNNNLTKRTFLEMCYIKENVNNINKKTDIDGLSSIYSYILSMEMLQVRPNTFNESIT